MAATAVAGATRHAVGPIDDYDFFWHVELGGKILSLGRITSLPTSWLAVPEPQDWLTTQWLAEVAMHVVSATGGMTAVLAVHVLFVLIMSLGLWVGTLRGRPVLTSLPIFLLALSGTAGMIMDRPQSASLVMLPWLALACTGLLTGHARPPLLAIALGSLVWAQLHGLWILAPVAFGLVIAGRLADVRSFRDPVVRGAAACVLASLVGLANPYGPVSFYLPLKFSEAADTVSEWYPTTLASGFTMSWAIIVALTFLAWARTPMRIPRAEIVWVLAWTAFGSQGYRNVAPAILLTAPLACVAMQRAWGGSAARLSRRSGPREGLALTAVCVLIVISASVTSLLRIGTVDPYEDVPARAMGAWVASQPGPVRIFNSYNAASGLIATGGGKARLVIDGRADLWGGDYIEGIGEIEDCRPGWRARLAAFRADVVVAPRKAAIVSNLSEDGWRIAVQDEKFVLLTPAGYGNTSAVQ